MSENYNSLLQRVLNPANLVRVPLAAVAITAAACGGEAGGHNGSTNTVVHNGKILHLVNPNKKSQSPKTSSTAGGSSTGSSSTASSTTTSSSATTAAITVLGKDFCDPAKYQSTMDEVMGIDDAACKPSDGIEPGTKIYLWQDPNNLANEGGPDVAINIIDLSKYPKSQIPSSPAAAFGNESSQTIEFDGYSCATVPNDLLCFVGSVVVDVRSGTGINDSNLRLVMSTAIGN